MRIDRNKIVDLNNARIEMPVVKWAERMKDVIGEAACSGQEAVDVVDTLASLETCEQYPEILDYLKIALNHAKLIVSNLQDQIARVEAYNRDISVTSDLTDEIVATARKVALEYLAKPVEDLPTDWIREGYAKASYGQFWPNDCYRLWERISEQTALAHTPEPQDGCTFYEGVIAF